MSTTTNLGLYSSSLNPATLPLLSTSLGLFYAIIEPTIFVPFLNASQSHPRETATVTRLWWTHFFYPGLTTITSIATLNLVGGIYTLRRLPRWSNEWKVAAAGLGFAMGHFVFGPKIAGVIQRLCDEKVEKRGETMVNVREWLSIHLWRTLLADIPAVGCFAWLVFGQNA